MRAAAVLARLIGPSGLSMNVTPRGTSNGISYSCENRATRIAVYATHWGGVGELAR
eukprot:SAG31_NODE_7015_length_1816_cov_1.718695_2_plen_55_part_01